MKGLAAVVYVIFLALVVVLNADDCETLADVVTECQEVNPVNCCFEEQHTYIQQCAPPLCAEAENMVHGLNCYTEYDPECDVYTETMLLECVGYEIDLIDRS